VREGERVRVRVRRGRGGGLEDKKVM